MTVVGWFLAKLDLAVSRSVVTGSKGPGAERSIMYSSNGDAIISSDLESEMAAIQVELAEAKVSA
eukprot:CAMPEP_0194447568 /NCGR_PEP_ID=MMETSP0176-20130528/129080_1 /TAXON_ID=216777 /ORGANISM="Proboscia alata, Strain PI-D3" /LENGTH=64 /DNA_ID=CAMNT_0039274435 /DNA_START=516 /DNA_END=710 /DNA_ORIENTATION=+